MNVYLFLTGSLLLNLLLSFFTQIRSSQKNLRMPLWVLAFLFPINAGIGYWGAHLSDPEKQKLGAELFLSLNIFIELFLIEMLFHFLRNEEENKKIALGKLSVPVKWLIYGGGLLLSVLCFVGSGIIIVPVPKGPELVFSSLILPVAQLLLAVYILYLLENTYRFAEKYQRKIGRFCFISLMLIGIYQIFFFARILLFRSFPPHFSEITVVFYGLTFPVILAGFLRYRLGSEKVSIPRDAVYTSATLFLTGAAFLGVALTVIILRQFEIDFSYFTRLLLGFSVLFFILLLLGSGNMRKRIIRYVNEQFYLRKYDYQEQFFQLHKTITTGSDLTIAVIELIENMKYSVTVDDAYVFLLNQQDGNFYLQENKEQATVKSLIVSGDSPLIRALEDSKKPLDFIRSGIPGFPEPQNREGGDVIHQLKIDALFPILHASELLGFLALRGGRSAEFDEEDVRLISVFGNSIGEVLFKNQVLKERIIQKQFESFHNISSFIIHDIKNQIATLTLILKNAEKNLQNPSFQQSMLSSVKSCSANLQNLIDKLAMGPQTRQTPAALCDVSAVIQDIVQQSGLQILEHIQCVIKADQGLEAHMDGQSLFFVLHNLVRNALEAMQNRGRLEISSGTLHPVSETIRELFPASNKFLAAFSHFILIGDQGPGMSETYIREKLFTPFSSTKEKGMGIGLYQCRTLIEKSGGSILCHSQLGQGTEFCILLK